MTEVDAKPPQENPLTNILVNVIVPVLVLSYLSKDPAIQETLGETVRPWHLGPAKAIIIALALPIGYGVWFFVRHRSANFFSILGFISVLLTGGLTLYLWNKDGSIKPHAAELFGLKEASIPLVLGCAIFASHWTKTPLLNAFLYSPQIFDLKRIEKAVEERNAQDRYRRLLFTSTIIFASSFLVSTVANFFLALHFLGGIDTDAPDALVKYNEGVAKLTGWGFAVIGVPILLLLFFLLWFLLRGLRALTGLDNEEIMLPR
ncbi:MAG: hypothetical protein HKN82_15865 [Akkermansiaceae bacterium]|nr:hypothetical protein [Akkermansiaceae bacterium]